MEAAEVGRAGPAKRRQNEGIELPSCRDEAGGCQNPQVRQQAPRAGNDLTRRHPVRPNHQQKRPGSVRSFRPVEIGAQWRYIAQRVPSSVDSWAITLPSVGLTQVLTFIRPAL